MLSDDSFAKKSTTSLPYNLVLLNYRRIVNKSILSKFHLLDNCVLHLHCCDCSCVRFRCNAGAEIFVNCNCKFREWSFDRSVIWSDTDSCTSSAHLNVFYIGIIFVAASFFNAPVVKSFCMSMMIKYFDI